jgi:hypothetical protein
MCDEQIVSLHVTVHPHATRVPTVTLKRADETCPAAMESFVSGLCTVSILIVVFNGHFVWPLYFVESFCNFQFLHYDHLLWRGEQLAADEYDVDSLFNGNIISLSPGDADGKEERGLRLL